MSHPNHIALTIAGGDSLVGQALELMLQSAGYDARFLDNSSSVTDPADPLEGTSLVLLAPRTSGTDREALLERLRNGMPDNVAVPVLELVGNSGAEDGEDAKVRRVLWPCQLKVLKREIENALLSQSP